MSDREEALSMAQFAVTVGAEAPDEDVVKFSRVLLAMDAQLQETLAVVDGVIWLDNNIHNYGSDGWRGYFKAVLRDARRAKALT